MRNMKPTRIINNVCETSGKNKFLSLDFAEMIAKRDQRGYEVYAYQCPDCGWFHLTKRPQKPRFTA